MHIFIDETGSFTGIGLEPPRISMLGALIVEDRRLPRLTRDYNRIRPSLPQHKGEVKGRLLNEAQVDSIVCLLKHHGAIFEAVLIDLGVHTEAGVSANRALYAESMTGSLSEAHDPDFRESVWSMRRRLESFPLQLYVQAQLTFRLVRNVIQNGTMYYSQRAPLELEFFHWIIDAKDRSGPTDWEDWWKTLILPQLQNESLKNPIMFLNQGNYSKFKKF